MHSLTVRTVFITTVTCGLFVLLQVLSAHAEDITMRARGSELTIAGEFISSGQRNLVIGVAGVGNLTLNTEVFECISGPCENIKGATSTPSPQPGSPQSITWYSGSAVGTEALPQLIKAYAASVGASVATKVGSDVRSLEFRVTSGEGHLLGQVNIDRQGWRRGFEALANGDADAVWTSSQVRSSEGEAAADASVADRTPPYKQRAWARDLLVVFVAKENPVASLSLDNIAKIFAGTITDWSELNLPPGKINVYAPSKEMGSWAHFDSQVLKPRESAITSVAVRLQHATQVSDRVAEDRFGIGVGSMAHLRNAKAVDIELSCGVVVRPSLFKAKTGEYPLTRQLYLYTADEPKKPFAKALLAFSMSQQAQPVLRKARLVDSQPETARFNDEISRITFASKASSAALSKVLLPELIQDVHEARRLSVTLRFASSDSNLDERGLSDIARLAMMMNSPETAEKSVILLGFSDSAGGFKSNLAVSRRRAERVRDVLIKVAGASLPKGTDIIHQGYGSLAQTSCNNTESGRALNRRVEVWTR